MYIWWDEGILGSYDIIFVYSRHVETACFLDSKCTEIIKFDTKITEVKSGLNNAPFNLLSTSSSILIITLMCPRFSYQLAVEKNPWCSSFLNFNNHETEDKPYGKISEKDKLSGKIS